MQISKLASAIYNDVQAGLAGYTSTPTMSLEQLEDDVVEERLKIIKEYVKANLLPRRDLLMSINCIPVDCKSMDKCCYDENYSEGVPHFEIPQLLNDFEASSIEYIGSVDKQIPFTVYTTPVYKYHHNRIRRRKKPYVYIDTTPNENNMYDGWIFDAPMLDVLSVVAIFKDPRQYEQFSCCLADSENFNFIDADIKKRVTENKLRYYRQLLMPPQQNDQIAK